ncbi:hypothetical protein MTZ49_01510 [Entomomonas sp. E2T0]|uniref:DUF7210 family protein n=1 Tax=Entomomonas sp. E2T0 TaxID=2930213 RepID=UPI00222823E4|nr:hypothetical protein [Entomomonas sp. E2T0]UYZ84285.1 hypothetical protein MTZ49_01510 [Entomomonas sp. E2T0]
MALKSITLIKPHEHQGVKYKAGDTIDVAPHTYDWLVERKVGEASKEAATETETPEAATSTKKTSKTKE